MAKRRRLLIFSLLLVAVGMSAEPIVRVVSAGGSERAFAADDVRKLVLFAENVDVVNNAGTVLLSVPKADIARVEFADGTPDTPTAAEATVMQEKNAVKIIENGKVYILHGGKRYTIMGVEVENNE